MRFIRELLSKDSPISSKRFTLLVLLAWIVTTGTFYTVMIQFGGKESASTENILIASLYAAISLAVGGTVAEAFSKKKKDE